MNPRSFFGQFGIIVSLLSSQTIQTLDAASQQVLLSVAQQPAGIAAQTAKSILSLHGFEFESSTCALPECCNFGEGEGERGQPEHPTAFGLYVYPNPANNEVIFELPNLISPSFLKVFDISGKVLWSTTFQHKVVWQASDIPSGLYFYTFVCEGQPAVSGKISIVK